MTVHEKLFKVEEKLGFPFAINGSGYDLAWDNSNGIQAWQCDKNAQGYGVEIYVFRSHEDIESWPEMSGLYESVERAEFFMLEDGDCIYFKRG